jgi:hypothetical protein
MKCSFLVAVACALLCAFPSAAEEPAKPKLRVLVTSGGHGFELYPFNELLDRLPGIAWKRIDMPKDADMLKPGLEKDYDVILMYDMVWEIPHEQQKAFVDLLNTGIGVVSWHHNLCAHPNWPEWRKIVGGAYLYSDTVIDGKPQKKSNYTEGVDYNVHIADTNHPITRGLQDFNVHDEVYGSRWTSPDVKILLTTDHPKSEPPLAWVHTYGKSRVFYMMIGHGSKAWNDATFQELLIRGIRWTAEK